MNCPYCDKEMEPGYLHSGNVILFASSPAAFMRLGTEFPVYTANPFKKPPKALYCSSCQKIIVDVERS